MRQIDGKYAVSGPIMNVRKGEVIPEDEPLVLMRGRDRLVPTALDHYWMLRQQAGAETGAQNRLAQTIIEMRQWQDANPGRTRLPDQADSPKDDVR